MARDHGRDTKRLFKSVPQEYDPRKIGTIRVGSLSFYRNHYDEAVADRGEGTGTVLILPGQRITLPAKLASALMGLRFMGEEVPRPGNMTMSPAKGGMTILQDSDRREVTLSGGCLFRFTALDALVFCMSAPSAGFSDTFQGKRTIWWIERSDTDEFAELVSRGLEKAFPPEHSFPFLSTMGYHKVATLVEHRPVEYVSRGAALDETEQGRLAALLFINATFIKPLGPPNNFQNEEEYRFQFRRVLLDARSNPQLPEFIDIPFAPFEKLIKFR